MLHASRRFASSGSVVAYIAIDVACLRCALQAHGCARLQDGETDRSNRRGRFAALYEFSSCFLLAGGTPADRGNGVITTQPPEHLELQRLLSKFRRRLGLEHVALRGLRAVSIAFGLVAVMFVVAGIGRWSLPNELTLIVPAALVLAALAGAVSSWPSVARAAREADQRLDLEERLITALDSVRTNRTSAVARAQIAGAIQVGRTQLGNWRSDRSALRQELVRALGFGSLALALLLFSRFGDQLPLPRPDLSALTHPAEPPASEAVIPDPPPLPKPDAAGGNAAVSPVLRALDDLRRARETNGVSQEDAERRVSQAESELQRQSSQSQAQRQDLNRLARGLSQSSAGRPAAESIERGDYQQAANQLTELGNEADQLSQAAKDQLSRELRSAAADTTQNRMLSERERRAGEALAGRDYAQQRRALRELGEEVARAGSFVVPQQDLAEGMSRVRDAQQELGQQPGPNQNEANQQGAPSGQGASQSSANAGAEQGQPAAQANQGGGAAPGDGEGAGQGAAGSAGGDQAGENRNDAAPRLEVIGRRVEVPVKVGRGPISQRPGLEDPLDSEDAPATVTSAGLNQPQEASAAAAERNLVPSDRRQTVRDYFRGEQSR